MSLVGSRAGAVDGIAHCRMLNRIIVGMELPHYLNSDHDPLFKYQQWQANLRILRVEEIKSAPYSPVCHPFVERLIGTIRQKILYHILIWNAVDLKGKLEELRQFCNYHRVHASLDGDTPAQVSRESIHTAEPIYRLPEYDFGALCC